MPLPVGKSLRQTFGEAVAELANEDPRILMLDGDLGSSTRADLFEKAHPDRYLPMGIAEQNMLGVAAGLATMGFIPFISTFVVFAVARALDQVRVLVAQPGLPVKITAGYSGLLTGMAGKTHQSVDDIAIMRTLPHMTVFSPADEIETRGVLRAAVEIDGPVYVRLARDPGPVLFDASYRFDAGRAVVVREGRDVTLIGTGVQTGRVVEAAELLAAEGIEAHVLHVPTIKPLDAAAIVAAAERTGLVVTVEEHSVFAGLGGAVAEVLGERRPLPVRRLGLQDVYGESGPNEALLEKYGLSARRVAEAVRAFLRERADDGGGGE
ncbi:MAG: transketolase [Chloroflexi bacterium GWC2_73_18]|nr:MAG: transketolase [Chloroflexi bacterium GWC2_73_18]